MNLFARAHRRLDRRPVAATAGDFDGRVKWLFIALFGEGIGLMLFSQATTLTLAIPLMIAVRDVREDVERRHVRRRAVHQSPGAGRGERASSAPAATRGPCALGFLFKTEAIDWHDGAVHAGSRGDVHFVRELRR